MPFLVYIITDGTNSKIGYTSRDYEKRLAEYRTHNPTADTHDVVEFQDEPTAKRVEAAVKAFYRPYQTGKGKEWFHVQADAMLDLVQSLAQRTALSGTQSEAPRLLHRVPLTGLAYEALTNKTALLEKSPGRPATEQEKKNAEKWRNEIATQEMLIRREFASAFNLGIHYDNLISNSKRVLVVKNPPVADLGHAPSPYSPAVREAIRRNYISPPFSDHVETFFHLAPLISGAYVAFCSALVSMPYKHHHSDASWHEAMKQMSTYANEVGWYCADHSEWSWHAPGKTGLILFQPITPFSETATAFSSSMKKYVIEHEKELSVVCSLKTIEDIIYDANFPLDVTTPDDLYKRYLNPLYSIDWHENSKDNIHTRREYEFLFTKWNN